MKKTEIIDAIAAQTGITRAQAKEGMEMLIGFIHTGMRKEGRFAVSGLGTFSVGKRAARVGRNPATGESIKIKASKTAKFRAAPDLKEAASKFKG
ncbi:HU family DNA-binding protein [Noviherbaspirillum pedocola]|uniref:Viral histone-like protein n=1 Tax=Noviherbaspirillum pedocola TaxID=2801341 RepID=A0A934W4L2_9BURK|nr:HU family DNA-binding protein [Noviherbaspirillum pedocola]MBK4738656.1 HU family DNA-binding protein [Noviherbaspirillum pedocola]